MHLLKVSQSILPLLVLGFLTCKCESADVYGTCSGHSECPSNARCRPNSCDGYICLCDEGFVASQDRRRCMKAAWIGEPCFNLTSRCVSLFAVCIEGTCRCLDSFVKTNDGRCKLPGSSFVGESCLKCEYPTHCVSGVCRCVDNYRPLSFDEYWVDPLSTLQCHPQSYALNKCNGTEIPAPLPLQALTRSTPIYPEREISGKTQTAVFGSCTSTAECPKFAKCKPGSCDGFLCICDSGFIASEDRTSCLRARRMAEACNTLTDRCMSPFSSCTNSFCECLDIFQPTRDGRCKMPGNNFLGEPCVNSEQCEYPSKCVNGSCVCVEPYRQITHEEFWIDPMITSQCRPIGFSVWKCNGTQLDIPKEVSSRQAMTATNRDAIPIDSSVRTTTEGKQDTKNVTNSKQDATVVKNVRKEITATERKPELILQKPNSDNSILIPLNIAGILAAAVLATLIALVLRSRKRQQTKHELNKHSTRSSSVSGDSGGSQVPIRIPRPSVKYEPYYVKDGWQTISTSFSSMPSNVNRHVFAWQEQSDPSSERISADFEA